MTKVLLLSIIGCTLVFGASSDANNDRKKRIEKQIQKEMQNEKKYSKEQTFYQADNYDFKGAEVNPDSVDSVPDIKVYDFNMDSVYD